MKVIFNYLPPGNINYPSPSLSILQSFLKQNGISARTVYWNILMFRLMSYYANNNDVLRNLFPFLSIIAKEHNDKKVQNRLSTYLQTLQPHYKNRDNFYSNSMIEMRKMVNSIFDPEINNENFSADIYGISARFYQWIPGTILAGKIKKKFPQSKIVIGGLNSKDSAVAMMKNFNDFDFAIWGEGEYPLLDLCNQIKNNSLEPCKIPRLVYRNGDIVKSSGQNKSKYLDFKNYIFPDNDDFFECIAKNDISKNIVNIPIHTVSGCRWNKCSFCNYSLNRNFRERPAENIFREITQSAEKYGVNEFYLVDNDISGKDISRFEKLLDLLIDYKKNSYSSLKIYGEMIPSSRITSGIFRKMSLAGFSFLFIGYEAVTDKLLKKMKKENSFSENIYFVKTAVKNMIKPQVNIIQGIPSETEDDITESIHNLHFLRFLLSQKKVDFVHQYSSLNIFKGIEYFKQIPDEEKENYDQNPVSPYIPETYTNPGDRFDLFGFRRNSLMHYNLWIDFATIEKFYRENSYFFSLLKNDTSLTYKEFFNDTEIKNIEYSKPVYYEILAECDDRIVSFKILFQTLSEKFNDLTESKLKEYLCELKNDYLIYFDDKISSIISLIWLNNE